MSNPPQNKYPSFTAFALGARHLKRWVDGTAGCIFQEQAADRGLDARQLKSTPGLGSLSICDYPMDLLLKPWYETSRHTGRAMIHVLLYRKFTSRKWFVMGDDDTIFNPLALARYLSSPRLATPSEAWYIGARSENVAARQLNGWDMAPGGAGIILSAGLLREDGFFLQRCLDVAPWSNSQATGDWVLNRCLGRLGVALTATGKSNYRFSIVS